MTARRLRLVGTCGGIAAIGLLAVGCASFNNGSVPDKPLKTVRAHLDDGRTLECVQSEAYASALVLNCDWDHPLDTNQRGSTDVDKLVHVINVQLEDGGRMQCISSTAYVNSGVLDCDWNHLQGR